MIHHLNLGYIKLCNVTNSRISPKADEKSTNDSCPSISDQNFVLKASSFYVSIGSSTAFIVLVISFITLHFCILKTCPIKLPGAENTDMTEERDEGVYQETTLQNEEIDALYAKVNKNQNLDELYAKVNKYPNNDEDDDDDLYATVNKQREIIYENTNIAPDYNNI